MKLLLLGATGLVGSHVLGLAIADERIGEVIAPTRRPLPGRPDLIAPKVDFNHSPEDGGVESLVTVREQPGYRMVAGHLRWYRQEVHQLGKSRC